MFDSDSRNLRDGKAFAVGLPTGCSMVVSSIMFCSIDCCLSSRSAGLLRARSRSLDIEGFFRRLAVDISPSSGLFSSFTLLGSRLLSGEFDADRVRSRCSGLLRLLAREFERLGFVISDVPVAAKECVGTVSGSREVNDR